MDSAMLLKLCGAVAVLCVARSSADGASLQQHEPSSAAVTATVEELPQRPMTLRNGYQPGPLLPFNKGEPFVVDDPNTSAIDFNTKPPSPLQRSDDYYDYDASKLEEVPYDYKGDPIDRKDVVEPNAPRPNDIKPTGVKNKQTDIYHFLNLPVKYSSSDKFPLMSSSYANTKIQGSGPSSSSLSNHKMPPAPQQQQQPAAPTTSWYNPVKTSTTTTTTTMRPTTTTTTTTTARPATTSTTTTQAPHQEYEEESVYDYDYYHPQEPASDTAAVTPSTTTTTTSTTQHHYQTPSTTTSTHHYQSPSTTAAASRPTASTTTTTTTTASAQTQSAESAMTDDYYPSSSSSSLSAVVLNKTMTSAPTTTTTARPEIDSKLDGPSFADYDSIKPAEGPHQQGYGGQQPLQQFKPLPGNYQFVDDKTYPLVTSGKVPMTFTAHVSSGISLNQKDQQQQQHHQQQQQQHQQHHQQQHHQQLTSDQVVKPASPSLAVSEPGYAVNRPSPPEIQDSDGPTRDITAVHDGPRITAASRPPPPDSAVNRHPSPAYTKQKPPPPRPSDNDQFETVYYKVRPDAPQFPSAVASNRPANPPPIPGRPYQPEPVMKTTVQDPSRNKQPPVVHGELLLQPQSPPSAQGRPLQPYPGPSDVYAQKSKPAAPPPQYAAPQSQPDTSKFKPPKHVINHFIKTQPNEDNKSYALQTSFSIGMDGERTETRPAQGIGQVLMVEDGSSESAAAVNQSSAAMMAPAAAVAVKSKATTSIPFVPPPPRPVQKPLPAQYPRPQWENIPKPPSYYPPPKRDGPPQPPPPPQQRPGLPNILPQFRPNAKVDSPMPMPMPPPPMMAPPQSHSATIERVQIPMDHLRPPPLPKPQFLKVDRNDEDGGDAALLDAASERETRIVLQQRPALPPQPARVTTLQMIQHGAPANKVRDDPSNTKENPVHVVYAANPPPPPPPPRQSEKSQAADDSVMLDGKDRSDVPVLKTKTAVNKPAKTDFPYQIVRPDDGQNASALDYKAYSPTRTDIARPNDQELVPNLQDYVPVVTRGDPAPNAVLPQRPITATLKTSEDNHRMPEDGHKPQLQNFQIPFQPSLKLPENSNGWSVVRKSQVDSASERIDEAGDAVASTEKFDPDNFKPQLVGGFMPINPLSEEAKEKKMIEQSERAK